MTFSYSGDPSTSQLDEVRFLVHDVDHDNPLLQDEEIEYVINRLSTVYDDSLMSAAMVADMIANRYASEVSITADGVSISGDQLQQKWQALATSLRETYKSLTGAGAEVYVGGLSVFDSYDLSIRPLSFGKGMHDNLRGGRQDYGQRGEIPEYPDRDDWATGTGGP